MTKVDPNNGNKTKLDIFPWDIFKLFKSDVISSSLKKIKVFQWLSKSKFLSFITEVNPNNGNETKSDVFPWDIFKLFKSDVISFLLKNIKIFQWFSKSKFLSFITEVNPNNENETK